MTPPSAPAPGPDSRWQRFRRAFVRGFHRYATWLVGISWKRFFLLSLLLLILMAIAQSLPPFTYTVTEWVEEPIERPKASGSNAPAGGRSDRDQPLIKVERPQGAASVPADGVDISIDERGIRIRPRQSSASSGPAPSAGAAGAPAEEAARIAAEQARATAEGALATAEQAAREAEQAAREAQAAAKEALEQARQVLEPSQAGPATRRVERSRTVERGEFLPNLALLWIVASIIIKITYKGRMQAEVRAAQATETAEAESLRRQVVEARMAAMQAQVEPHFLFNTLASIEHLIETDPKRAGQMQRNLIALLRASMPTMREASDGGPRELGRELQVIRPYLEILKVRMEERLTTVIDVPEGLYSAEFPPMMIQTLVENAIKHGLEPKPEGGTLGIRAEIVHGKLAVSVTDTGLGFGEAATSGTGVGLANIRERLQLLYGSHASLTVAAHAPSGTVVTICVPYRSLQGVCA